MNRHWLATRVVALVAALLACGNAVAQTAAAPVKMRIQTAVPSASIYFELLKRMGDRVDKMSAGRVKMEFLPDGAIVPAFEILDAVDKGIVEGGYAWTHYWSGKNPTAGLFSNPMAGAGVGLDQLSHVARLERLRAVCLEYQGRRLDVADLALDLAALRVGQPDDVAGCEPPVELIEGDPRLLRARERRQKQHRCARREDPTRRDDELHDGLSRRTSVVEQDFRLRAELRRTRRSLVRLRAKRYGETSTKLEERSRGGGGQTPGTETRRAATNRDVQ